MTKDTISLVQTLLGITKIKNIKISFAESCTGGMIGAAITQVSGASESFLGSAVTYSNEAKMNVLGVSPDTLNKWGAVSSECAVEMAAAARKIYNSDIAMSVTGIAGPNGGSKEKPVGTVWLGFSSENKVYSFMRVFKGDRNKVREAAVKQVLFYLIEKLG